MTSVLAAAPAQARRDCPYVGLAPYSAADRPYFFGRRAERRLIAQNLLAHRLTLVYGDSGVGKTSVLSAGVVADLEGVAVANVATGRPAELLPVVVREWSGDPMQEISRRLAAAGAALDQPEPSSDSTLSSLLEAWSAAVDGTVLLILDQFEELLLYHGGERDGFASELARAISDPQLDASFLISIREDALARLDRFKGRVRGLFDNLLRLEPLEPLALIDAIEAPLATWNRERDPAERVEIEPALTAAIVKGVTGERRGVVTPFLQLAMTRLWADAMERGVRTMQQDTLERLGGVADIVSSHLRSRLDLLNEAEQAIVARILNQLVTPSGTKVAHRAEDLAAYAGSSVDELMPVLGKLSGSDWRILRLTGSDTPGDTRYEIFHDVLADPILDWRARYDERNAALEVVAERQAEAKARRTRRIRRGLLASLAALVLICAGLLFLALSLRDDAEHSSEAAARSDAWARSRALGEGARLMPPADRLTTAISAVAAAPSDEAQTALRAVLGAPVAQAALGSAGGAVKDVDVSPNGDVVTVDESGPALWHKLGHGWGRGSRVEPPLGSALPLHARFSPDGSRFVTVSRDGHARFSWVGPGHRTRNFTCSRRRAERGSNPLAPDAATRDASADVPPPAWTPDGRRVFLACGSDVVAVTASGKPSGRSMPLGFRITALALSGDGRRLAAAGSGHVEVRETSTGRRLLAAGGAPVRGVAPSAAGNRVAVARTSGSFVYDVGAGRQVRLGGPASNAIAISPDGRWVATASDDARARIWAGASGRLAAVLPSEADVESVAFSRDGSMLVTASRDGAARLWRVPDGVLLSTMRRNVEALVEAQFGAGGLDGRVIVSDEGGTVEVWRALPQPDRRLGLSAPVRSVSLDPTGGRALTLDADGVATIWDLASPARTKLSGRWRSAALGPGFAIAVPEDRGPAMILDTQGAHERALSEGAATLASLASDGRSAIVVAANGSARRVAVPGGRALQEPPYSVERPVSVALSADGSFALMTGTRVTMLWNVRKPEASVTVSIPDGLTATALAPTRRRIALAGPGSPLAVWDGAGTVARMTVPGANVSALAFSPDGAVLAIADDGVVGLWDARTRELLQQVMVSRERVAGLTFSPDGRRLFVAAGRAVDVFPCAVCGDARRLLATARGRRAAPGSP
jgi:WD40 repeat protein